MSFLVRVPPLQLLPRIRLTGHATEVVVTARDDAGLIGCCYAEQCRMEDASQSDSEHIDPGSTTTRSAAEVYARNGWSVIPIPHQSKNPGFKGWEQMRLTVEALDQHFNGHPQNIGVLLGEPSGWLIDVDLDHMRAVELAPQFLPATPAIFGRPGKPRSHWIYRVSAPAATKKFRSKSAGMLVEFRSTGMQTVFPPSTHESGESICWDQTDHQPATVEPGHLLECVQRLADAVKVELGEKQPAPEKKKRTKAQPQATQAATTNVDPADRSTRCLAAMLRIRITDQRDGSHRLFVAACRAVEYDLDDAAALATICEYTRQKPFPKAWGDDEIIRRVRDAEGQCRRGQALEVDAEGCIALGGRDPVTGRLVISPKKTLPTADAYVRDFHLHPQGRAIQCYAGLLMEWRDNRYSEVEDNAVKKRLQVWLHESLRYIFNRRTEELELVDYESNAGTINSALESIRAYTHLPATVSSPSWLGNAPHALLPNDILPCRSTLLHLPTMKHFPATPQFFTVNALEFDPDPAAPPPTSWHQFLHQLFDGDTESLDLLQEWFGYCLTGDTSQQKMMLMVGPKRSGKGTIARVLTRLIGNGNVSGPTTSSLAGPFGLQPLIGKTLAIVSDARFHGENIATVVERLLCISGEDTLTVDRKHTTSVTMKLPTRFMFLTNEFPRLHDASGALAGRFVILRLTESFYGKEDIGLTERLLNELPGILNWAIEGWRRLRERSHFVMPTSVRDVVQEIEDLSSPVSAFVRDACIVGAGHRVSVDSLYDAWKRWCEDEGRQAVTTKQTFGRDLAAAIAGITRRRGTAQQPFYEGIALKGGW
jgi:putative DNA primase/helicase